MKKYKNILDAVLLLGLAAMCLFAIAPKKFVMPTSLQMLLLAVVIGLIASFLLVLWRENPDDEREMHNQNLASRAAYIVGVIVLIIALLVQSINHHIDPSVPTALFAMIATKVIVQRYRDGN